MIKMVKREFKRGIEPICVLKAKHFFEKTNVGKAICDKVREGELYVCIRDNYFNVYRNGCSLLEYKPNARKHNFLIHKKYWGSTVQGINSSGEYYLSLDLSDGSTHADLFVDSIIMNPNENLERYLFSETGEDSEKELLQAYIKAKSPCLIDLEVAFSCEAARPNAKRHTVAKRIDMAVLEQVGRNIELRFVEAKVVFDSRLKTSSMKADPEIVDQLSLYECFLREEDDAIQKTYKNVARNYSEDFPYLLRDGEKELMERYCNKVEPLGWKEKKPSLLLLSNKKPINSVLMGRNGKNNGNHYQTLKDKCDENDWAVLEWVKH